MTLAVTAGMLAMAVLAMVAGLAVMVIAVMTARDDSMPWTARVLIPLMLAGAGLCVLGLGVIVWHGVLS